MRAIIEQTINPVRGDIEALSNDVKEICGMLADLQKQNSNTNINVGSASGEESAFSGITLSGNIAEGNGQGGFHIEAISPYVVMAT